MLTMQPPKHRLLYSIRKTAGVLPKFFIWVVLLAFEAHAQEVRLTQVIDLALTSHPTVLQARSQAQAAGFDLDAAKWGRYPSLSSEVRSDSAYTQSIAKLEQPLWAGGRIDGRVAVGEANVRVAAASVQEAQINALVQASSAFFEMLRLITRLDKARDNEQEHQKLVGLIERRVQAQISPPADLTLAQARLQQATTDRLQVQRQLESTRSSLTQWIGPIGTQGTFVAPRQIVYERAPNHEALIEQAMQVSGQRQKLLAQIDSANAQIDLAKAQGMPTVVAGYQHIVSGPLVPGSDRGRAYVGMQFQPGAGLSALSGIQSSVSKKEAAEQELQVFERSLEAQLKTLYSDIDVLQAQMGPAQALERDTADLVDSYLRQYQIGRKNWLDVLNALREKAQAIYSITDVRYALSQSQVRLLILNGVLPAQKETVIHE